MKWEALLATCWLSFTCCTADHRAGAVHHKQQEPDSGSQVFTSDYVGQEVPGLEPVVFAPGLISTDRSEVAFDMSPDGKEACFVRFFSNSPRIMCSRHTSEGWSAPARVPFTGEYFSSHPTFSPDGSTLYFSSGMPLPPDWPGFRPAPDSRQAIRIWRVSQDGTGRSPPQPVFIPEGDGVADASVAGNGTIYTTGILRSVLENGRYGEPEELNPPMEGHWPYVAPDENFIVFGHGFPRRLLVSFRRLDGTWTIPRSCSDGFGFRGAEMNGMPFVTPDGKYLFFSAKHDIYWVAAEVMWNLQSDECENGCVD